MTSHAIFGINFLKEIQMTLNKKKKKSSYVVEKVNEANN